MKKKKNLPLSECLRLLLCADEKEEAKLTENADNSMLIAAALIERAKGNGDTSAIKEIRAVLGDNEGESGEREIKIKFVKAKKEPNSAEKRETESGDKRK